MRHLLPFLRARLNRPVATTVFASDAEGENEVDLGGYGAVATVVAPELAEQALQAGTRSGRVVTKLDGSIAKWISGEKELAKCVAVSRLPRELITEGAQDWTELLRGRWRWKEHIMMGEGRVALKAFDVVSSFSSARGHVVLLLEDNEPFSAASAKGRSPTYRVNVLLRRKTAQEIVADIEYVVPWLDTASQPADAVSRLKQEAETHGVVSADGAEVP